ncbi:hypothetical protein GCM10020331_047140 [Ectobacillus funiculus]
MCMPPYCRSCAAAHRSTIRLYKAKKKTGVTIMYMVEKKLDAGDMLTQVEVPIEERDTVGTLHDKLSAAGAELFIQYDTFIIGWKDYSS